MNTLKDPIGWYKAYETHSLTQNAIFLIYLPKLLASKPSQIILSVKSPTI